VTDAWRVVVDVAAADAELTSDALWQHGALGIEERELGASAVRLIAGMADRATAQRAAAALDGAHLEAVEGDEWADAWKAWAKPSWVGDVLVQPAWLAIDPTVAAGGGPTGAVHVVFIDPGRTFGSGSHASTRLALAAVLEHTPSSGRVLDVGCGSGVLGVAAGVARRAHVLGIDIDPAAVDATLENARRNGVADLVTAATTSIADVDEAFDVVVANVLAVTLRELARPIVARVAPGGVLLLSGMLREQTASVAAAYRAHGLHVVDRTAEDQWDALVLRRVPS
jgi:ribosomal protein L11 methyltransferase